MCEFFFDTSALIELYYRLKPIQPYCLEQRQNKILELGITEEDIRDAVTWARRYKSLLALLSLRPFLPFSLLHIDAKRLGKVYLVPA